MYPCICLQEGGLSRGTECIDKFLGTSYNFCITYISKIHLHKFNLQKFVITSYLIILPQILFIISVLQTERQILGDISVALWEKSS